MHLIYLDESGNTGNNLADPEQPIFVLGALVVPETCWQNLEADLIGALAQHSPAIAASGDEIHSSDLRSGRGAFKGTPVPDRIALRDAWLRLAHSHGLKFVYRSIEKKRYQGAIKKLMGPGIAINPHVAAFPLVALVVNELLVQQNALGMFISDECKQIVRDVEKSIHSLRLHIGPLRLSQIVEKGFFIDSRKSRILQLCDLCVFQSRKQEERVTGANPKSFDDNRIELLKPLVHRGNEQFNDVLQWLKREMTGT